MIQTIPYKELDNNMQCFIRQDGKFFNVEKSHEEFAKYYCNNYLSKKEKELFELWLSKYNTNNLDIYGDFLVKVLSYDKISTRIKNQIVTTSFTPHIRFYNYYLMNYNITVQNKLIYDQNKEMFYIYNNLYRFNSFLDYEYKEEIDKIKSKTLIKDRHNFYK